MFNNSSDSDLPCLLNVKKISASLLTMLFGLDLFLYGFFEVKELPSVTVYRDYLRQTGTVFPRMHIFSIAPS